MWFDHSKNGRIEHAVTLFAGWQSIFFGNKKMENFSIFHSGGGEGIRTPVQT